MNAALDYMRENNILLVEALLLVFLSENGGSAQFQFGDKYSMCRNQTSQLYSRASHKGWIYVKEGNRRRIPGHSFKKYYLTPAGEEVSKHLL